MEKLQLFFPDNSPFLSPIELSKSLQQAQQEVEIERQQRQQAQQTVEIERQQRQQAQQAVEIERLSNQKLREKLRSLGIDPDGDI